jgi:hypothetical protein
MKKLFLMLALMSAVLSANAQIATENSNALDNISVGVTAGVSTPLDFNSIFPLNTNVGLKIQKDFTPVFGLQAEGIAVLNDNHFSDIKTAVKATNVGLNGVFNLSNIFKGYRGTPRTFEVSTVTGLGWLHTWNTSDNFLTAKTGLDLAWNLGKKKANSIVFTPAVYWNLNKIGDIYCSKNNAADAKVAIKYYSRSVLINPTSRAFFGIQNCCSLIIQKEKKLDENCQKLLDISKTELTKFYENTCFKDFDVNKIFKV